MAHNSFRKHAERLSNIRRQVSLGPKAEQPWVGQENKIARVMKGKRTAGSGNGRQKGDVIAASFMLEGKTTKHDSIDVKRAVLSKNALEAQVEGKGRKPITVIGFDKGVPGADNDFAVMPLHLFHSLVMAAEMSLAGNFEEAREYARQVIQ